MWARTLIAKCRSTWWWRDKNPEAGYASETVLVTALLIIGALVVIGIILSKVTSKAQDIDLTVGLGVLATVVL